MSNASDSDSKGASTGAPPTRFARACTRCRQQKLACKPGRSGTYPCARCEDSASQCILVEKQRPTPIPTLSSKLSRQEASLSDLAEQLHTIQTRLSFLQDIPARLSALEHRYSALLASSSPSGSTPANHLVPHPATATPHPAFASTSALSLGAGGAAASAAMAPPSSYGPTPSPVRTTSSLRDVHPIDLPDDIAAGHTGPMGEDHSAALDARDKAQESRTVVSDFENADINSTRLLTDVRVYRRRNSSARPAKRKRVEEERDALAVAFTLFTLRCLPAVNFFDPNEPEFNATWIRQHSPLLFWAVIAVGARETPELNEIYAQAHENTMELLRQTLGGPRPTYWDLCGAMVWNKWLAPVRPIGHVVDMAYELDVHRTYEAIRDKTRPAPEDVKKIRLWIAICIQDYFLSVATGRPPHYPHRTRVFEQARWLVSLPDTARNDFRLLATYEYEEIAHSIQDELIRTGILSDDWESQVNTRIAAIDEWYARWEPIALGKSSPDELCSMIKSIRINLHVAKLSVYSVVLRGVRTTEDLTPQRLRYVGLSVESARAECQLCVKDFQGPAIQYLGESQLYAFITAAVFLLKVIWLLPSTYDTTQIFQEVEAVIETFRAVSGQLHAHFLAQILKHVRSHHHEAQMRAPTLMPTATEYASAAPPPPSSSHAGKGAVKANGAGTASLPFNPFETSLAGVDGHTHAQAHPSIYAAHSALANGGAGLPGEASGGMPGPDVFGEPENDFWSWLQSEGQSFSPLVNTLDTFDSSIAMGGL